MYSLCLLLMTIFASYSSSYGSSHTYNDLIVGHKGRYERIIIQETYEEFRNSIIKKFDFKDKSFTLLSSGKIMTEDNYKDLIKNIHVKIKVFFPPIEDVSESKKSLADHKSHICDLLFKGEYKEIKNILNSIKNDKNATDDDLIGAVTIESILRN